MVHIRGSILLCCFQQRDLFDHAIKILVFTCSSRLQLQLIPGMLRFLFHKVYDISSVTNATIRQQEQLQNINLFRPSDNECHLLQEITIFWPYLFIFVAITGTTILPLQLT